MTDSKHHTSERKPHQGPMGGGPRIGMPFEKPKDFKKTLRRLLAYLNPWKYVFLAVFLLSIASTVFMIFSPKVMGRVTTHVFESFMDGKHIDFSYIGRIVVILLALYLASGIFAYVQQYVMAGVSQKTVYQLRNQISVKLMKLPLAFFDGAIHGDIMSRITNDIDNISNTLQQGITQLITSFVTLVGIVIMMLSISPLMTLILLVTLPLYAITTKIIAKHSQKYFKGQQKALGELNGHVEEMLSGHVIVKAFGHEKKSLEKFASINENLYHEGWKAQFISGIIMPAMTFINNIGYVMVSVIGGIFVTRALVSLGDIQAFIIYSRQFTQPIIQVSNIANIIQSTIASAERVFEILDEEEEIPDDEKAIRLNNVMGRVTFKDVHFSYKKDTSLIEGLNIDILPGQNIAIVGPTGAGKTTLVNLMMRFYELDAGEILLDGNGITNIKRGSLRSAFGMVLQDTWLFNGTIRDNIRYGRLDARDEDVLSAAESAHVHHFIQTVAEGYDTILNEDASNISYGQKQLLTIARAFLANPAILILDEATSNVDTRTEIIIQKAMKTLMKGRTNFIIAHRLSTIKNADLILVMNNGQIIEKGTHEELLSLKSFYWELYNSQFTLNEGLQ
ncbi:MAG: ABC transporter ATP-binding protein [Clostridia bacterium]